MQSTISVSRWVRARDPDASTSAVTALVLLWARDEPERVGEVALVPGGFPDVEICLGRSADPAETPAPPIGLLRQRPGLSEDTGPLRSPSVSRAQLVIRSDRSGALTVANQGRGELLHNGRRVEATRLEPGDLLEVSDRLLFLCERRPRTLPAFRHAGMEPPLHPFGEADAHGVVGESLLAWQLREELCFLGARQDHVLIRGPSGSGKELIAQALHRLSPRARKKLVSRNAATIPASLVDAELFGHARNYPNPGSPERPGLIGEADGGSLFLDEFAELPVDSQAHLLRVLDAGEYHRLGDPQPKTASLRLLAATNRSDEHIKHDVLARFKLRLELPGLDERREDVPLLARHLLKRILDQDPGLASRFTRDALGAPRMTPALVAALVRHPYATHVRELELLLWEAMRHSRGDVLDLYPELEEQAAAAPPEGDDEPPGERVDPASLSPEEIQACLDRHGGVQDLAWRELGLSSRHALARLVKKHGLKVRGRVPPAKSRG